RDDRSARIRTRTSEVGARDASGYTTDLDPRFPTRRRVPVCRWTVLCRTACRQEGVQRREAAAKPTPVREARADDLDRTGLFGAPPGACPFGATPAFFSSPGGAAASRRAGGTGLRRRPGRQEWAQRRSGKRVRPAGVDPARLPYQSSALH